MQTATYCDSTAATHGCQEPCAARACFTNSTSSVGICTLCDPDALTRLKAVSCGCLAFSTESVSVSGGQRVTACLRGRCHVTGFPSVRYSVPSWNRAAGCSSGRQRQLTIKVTPAAKSSRSCAGFGLLFPNQIFSTSEKVCVPAARRAFDAMAAECIGHSQRPRPSIGQCRAGYRLSSIPDDAGRARTT